MRRSLILSGILVCSILSLHAQLWSPQVVASSGESYSSPTGQIEFTIGEVVTSSFITGSNLLSQGFHQPQIIITSIERPGDAYSFRLYPNPTEQFVTVETAEDMKMRIRVSDALGNIVLTSSVFTQTITIDLQSLISGNYILVITNASGKTLFSYILFKN